MTATHDNIFVEPFIEKEGEVFVPPIFRRRHQMVMKGKTVHCGPNAIISEGETVLFSKWADNEITLEGKKLLMIKPYHILAIQ